MVFQAMAIGRFILKLHTLDITPLDSTTKFQIDSPLKRLYEVAALSTEWVAVLSALQPLGTLITPPRKKCFIASKN